MYADGGFVQPGLRRLFALNRPIPYIYKGADAGPVPPVVGTEPRAAEYDIFRPIYCDIQKKFYLCTRFRL